MHEPSGLGPRDFKIAYKLHKPRGILNESKDEISYDLKSVLDSNNTSSNSSLVQRVIMIRHVVFWKAVDMCADLLCHVEGVWDLGMPLGVLESLGSVWEVAESMSAVWRLLGRGSEHLFGWAANRSGSCAARRLGSRAGGQLSN